MWYFSWRIGVFNDYMYFVSDARMTLVVGCMLLVATVLTPLLWHLWIHAGSANANFYFAMSVVYGIPQVCMSCYPRGS